MNKIIVVSLSILILVLVACGLPDNTNYARDLYISEPTKGIKGELSFRIDKSPFTGLCYELAYFPKTGFSTCITVQIDCDLYKTIWNQEDK